METIIRDFNQLRYLIYNLKTEINICISYYREYIIFLRNISIKPEFAFLYELGKDDKKIPIRVSDARLTPEGHWRSKTGDTVALVKRFLRELYNYRLRLRNYIYLLYRETLSLITGIDEYRQILNYCCKK